MAAMDYYHKLKLHSNPQTEQQKPVLSTASSTLLSVSFVALYVVPFYLSSKTRPTATLNRDNPTVIRARIRSVNLAVVVSLLTTVYVLYFSGQFSLSSALHHLGLYPIDPLNIIKSLLLTAILFLGPLYERTFVNKEFTPLSDISHQIRASLSSWLGYRTYIVGPVTEELLFRSAIVTVHLLAHMSVLKITFLTPLYFGIAHIHHFYEFTVTHPHTPWTMALLRSLFHVGYTSVFGWYASFIFLRLGNIYAVILIHAFCNYMGLPRVWGRLKVQKEPSISSVVARGGDNISNMTRGQTGRDSSLGHTVAYYMLLFAGAFGFYKLLLPLTESSGALAAYTA